MKKSINKVYLQKKKRYLKKIQGTVIKPRLSVFRSHKHIYAQLIDDENGHTLSFSSTLDKKIKLDASVDKNTNSTASQYMSFLVGSDLAKKAKIKKITSIVFDRGNYPYHGRIKSLAEGARQEGLIF